MTDKEQRKELELYFNQLYKADEIEINNIISKMDNVQAKAFLKGYNYAHIQPHTRTIRLLVMYVLDFIPSKYSIKDLTTKIRDIFRKKLYPKGFMDKQLLSNNE